MSEFTQKINIETLILVAVWEQPFVFQGCFQIVDAGSTAKILYYFRCECEKSDHTNRINNNFSPLNYHFSHLFSNCNLIPLDNLNDAKDAAIYVLKYALHITLLEMLRQEKKRFLAIDDIAMHAMIERIKPMLDQNVLSNLEDGLGFAASVEFKPQEKTTQSAVSMLLTKFADFEFQKKSVH
ncbi:Uncharacterised protein [Legionella beliardensis]|uniref:Uncharacterized protein n=1 Tax=Legionella beliardensis TaxID=91822 RepID=A0A378I1H3_9GAMM|nr:hypothetical protein [Legionella beliardensis]STX28581.1 Uncharacterised protein [Legionella beliardensis]